MSFSQRHSVIVFDLIKWLGESIRRSWSLEISERFPLTHSSCYLRNINRLSEVELSCRPPSPEPKPRALRWRIPQIDFLSVSRTDEKQKKTPFNWDWDL
uniref:Uncharacterized protein n=1 Tax=Strongyloides venezuelensis TaxID=75913 RepID=A0A0K0FDA2_STRVS